MLPDLIILDLEQTLLSNRNDLSAFTKQIIQEFSKKHIVCLITGSNYTLTSYIHKELGLNTLFSTNQGCYIYDGDKPIYTSLITKHDITCLVLQHQNIIKNLFFLADQTLFSTEYDKRLLQIFHIQACNYQTAPLQELPFKETDMLFLSTTAELPKISCASLKIDALSLSSQHKLYRISNQNASKKAAAQFIKSYYHGQYENVLIIGDSDYDLSMKENHDIFISMKNAFLDIQEKADYVTQFTNEENGVAYFLLDYYKI